MELVRPSGDFANRADRRMDHDDVAGGDAERLEIGSELLPGIHSLERSDDYEWTAGLESVPAWPAPAFLRRLSTPADTSDTTSATGSGSRNVTAALNAGF